MLRAAGLVVVAVWLRVVTCGPAFALAFGVASKCMPMVLVRTSQR